MTGGALVLVFSAGLVTLTAPEAFLSFFVAVGPRAMFSLSSFLATATGVSGETVVAESVLAEEIRTGLSSTSNGLICWLISRSWTNLTGAFLLAIFVLGVSREEGESSSPLLGFCCNEIRNQLKQWIVKRCTHVLCHAQLLQQSSDGLWLGYG